jgi:hypothetical protein
MSGPADDILKKYELCYLFNETFGYYRDREGCAPRQDLEKELERLNQCKGGRYVIHTKQQADEYCQMWMLRTPGAHRCQMPTV